MAPWELYILDLGAGAYGSAGGLKTVAYREKAEMEVAKDGITFYIGTPAARLSAGISTGPNVLDMVGDIGKHQLIVRQTLQIERWRSLPISP